MIKFGRPAYRREAWLNVRKLVRALVPAEVFEAMDKYFSGDAPKHFTHAFPLDELEAMLAATTKQKPARLKLQGRDEGINPLK